MVFSPVKTGIHLILFLGLIANARLMENITMLEVRIFIPQPSAIKATLLSLGLIALVALQACVHGPSRNSIGMFTSVQGQAVVVHADESEPIDTGARNGALSEDLIETKQGTRAEARL